MKKNNHRILQSIVCVLVCMLCLSAYAGWQPTFVTDEQTGYLGPDDTIRLRIPADVPIAELQRLVLELDAIDVTAMVQRDGEYALYKPLQPLTPGHHKLRVVEYVDDGSILELGFWSFEVRQSKLFREYAAAADTQVAVNYRMADNNLTNPPPARLQGQGSSQVSYVAASGAWHTSGEFDLLYNSNTGQENRRELDNGEFLFSAGTNYADVYVGHQSVGTASLVMDNFRRRGVSLQGRIPTINSQVSGFLLSSEAVSGFQRGLAIGDADRRVDGVTFDSSPLKNKPQALFLSGTWLDGQGNDSSGAVASATGAEPGQSMGRAWSVSADSQLFGNHLRLRAEYAGSDYDFNTSDTLDSERDTAYNLLVTFTDITDTGMNWNIGVESREIGTFFKSLANQALPSDRLLDRVFAGTQWATAGMQASYEQQTDNVNDIEQLPRIKVELSSLSLNWSPNSVADWLGAPSLATLFSRQLQKQTFTPQGFLLPETDNDLDSLQLSGMFSYPWGTWGLTVANSQFRDHAGMQNDTDTSGGSLDASWHWQQHLALSPSIRYDRTADKVTDQSSTAITYALQVSFGLLPSRLDGSFDVSLNQNQSTDDSIDSETFSINAALNWHLLAAQRNRPGFDLSLSGLYNEVEDDVLTTNSLDTYQVFLVLTTILPTRVGRAL